MKSKVAIQYGGFEGPWHGKRFRKALKRAGYEIVVDSLSADIIVAHSAGCFWLPQAPTQQKLLLINPPYWPGKSMGRRWAQHLKSNLRLRRHCYSFAFWLQKNFWNTWYGLTDFKQLLLIIRVAKSYDLTMAIKNQQAIIARNQYDDWLTDDLNSLDIANPKLIIKQLPGDHDDCWANPEPYIELLQLLV